MFRHTRRKPRSTRRRARRAVLACPGCGSDKACPVEWAADGEQHWWLLIRCGECETWTEATIDNEQAAKLDLELNRQQQEIAGALTELEAERMTRDADLLATALDLDLVDADDFAR